MRKRNRLQLHIFLLLALALCMALPVHAEGEEPLTLTVDVDPESLLSEAGEVSFFRFTVKNTLDVAYDLEMLMLQGDILDEEPKLIAEELTIQANDVLEFPLENVRIEEDEFDRDLAFQLTWRTVSYSPDDVDHQTAFINDHALTAYARVERFVEPVMTIAFEPDVLLAREGDMVTVTYTLTNDTKFDMTNITLQDAGLPQPTIMLERNTLYAGEQMRVQALFPMGTADLNLQPSAQYTVRGIESRAAAPDSITVENVRVELQLEIEKYPATAQGTLFRITITNTGSHPMTDIRLTDEIGTLITEGLSLEAGASRTISHTVPSAISSGNVRYIGFVASGTDCVGGTITVQSPSSYEILPYVDSDQVRLSLAVTLTGSNQKEDGTNLLKVLFEIRNDSTVPIHSAVVTEGEYFRSNVNEFATLATGATTFEKEFIVSAGTRSLTFVMTAVDPSQTQYSTAPMTLDLAPVTAPKATNPPAIRPGKTVDTTGTIYDTDRYARIVRYAALIALALTMVFLLLSVIFHVAEINIRRWLPRELVVRPFGPKKAAMTVGPRPEQERDPVRTQFGYQQPAKLRYMERTDRFATVEEPVVTTAPEKPLPAALDTQAGAPKVSIHTEGRSRRKTGEITAVTIKKARVRPVMITGDDTAPFSLPHEAKEEAATETLVLRKKPVEIPEMPAETPAEATVTEEPVAKTPLEIQEEVLKEPFAEVPVNIMEEAAEEPFADILPNISAEPSAEIPPEAAMEAPLEISAQPEPEAERPAQPRVIEIKPLPRVLPRQRREIVRVKLS